MRTSCNCIGQQKKHEKKCGTGEKHAALLEQSVWQKYAKNENF